jgi:polyisoprenoid-binding protein YceI
MRLNSRFSWSATAITALIPCLMAGNTSADTYDIDASHSEVAFKVRHMGVSNTSGNFNAFTGSFELDPKDLSKTKGQATIEVASIDTDHEKRDEHLKGADFFDVEKFPKIEFVSKSVKKVNMKDTTCELVGTLTIKGVAKDITLKVKGHGIAKNPWGQTVTGFTAQGVINREDYGLTWNKALETGGFLVGKEVTLDLSFEAALRAPAAPESKPKK